MSCIVLLNKRSFQSGMLVFPKLRRTFGHTFSCNRYSAKRTCVRSQTATHRISVAKPSAIFLSLKSQRSSYRYMYHQRSSHRYIYPQRSSYRYTCPQRSSYRYICPHQSSYRFFLVHVCFVLILSGSIFCSSALVLKK